MESNLSFEEENGKTTAYGSFKKELSVFTQESSFHGFARVADQRISSKRRIMWTLILFIGSATLLFVTTESFKSFLSFGVKTTIKDVYSDELVFPAVTICNINRYRKSQINGTDFEKWLFDTYSAINFLIYKREPDAELIEDLNRTEFMLQSAHQKESMISGCVWNSEFDLYCGHENFSTVFTDNGVCYTFNGDIKNPLIAKRTGPTSGLTIYLYIEKEEYSYSTFESSVGVKVSIHPQDEPSSISFRALHAPQKGSSFIGIKHSEIISKPSPYSSNCQSGGLGFFKRYSYYGCLAEQISNEILNTCGCKEPYMLGIDARVCNFNESVKCGEIILSSLQVKCRTPCKRILYAPEISYATFPSEHVLSDMTVYFNKTVDQLRGNFVALTIFYKDFVSQVTEETEEFGLFALVGNIGGILGICLGASALSIYELFEFICASILNYIQRTKKISP